MTSATQFLEILDSSLSPLVDRERTLTVHGQGNLVVNFFNLSPERHAQQRGGGAESENNRMLFFVQGFSHDRSVPANKIKVEQSVNSIRGAKNMRAKAASPDKIALYLAKYLNETAGSVPPNLTHE